MSSLTHKHTYTYPSDEYVQCLKFTQETKQVSSISEHKRRMKTIKTSDRTGTTILYKVIVLNVITVK